MKTKPQTRILAVCFFLFLAIPARAYYNPEQGRWISRDPLGEQNGGKNLFAFSENEPLSRTDGLGLLSIGNPAVCYQCRCKKPSIGPVSTQYTVFLYGDREQHFAVGPPVPFKFETEGMLPPSFCKCKFRDSGRSYGTINGKKFERDFRTFDKPYVEKEFNCATSDVDAPGFSYENYPRDKIMNIELTVSLTLTVICDGTDGSHEEASVEVKYSTVIPPFPTPK